MARDAREVWAKRVEQLADSGLTAKEFAAEIGVNANTLAGWKWRLSSRQCSSELRSERTRRGPAVEVGMPLHVRMTTTTSSGLGLF